MKIGEGKVVDDKAAVDIDSDRPVYGKNLLEEGGKEPKTGAKPEATRILTKADILMGKDKRVTVHLEHYDKDVVVRPLTDGELSQVFEVIGNVPLNEQGLPDLNKVDISTNLRALRLITAMGLVEPKMSEDEVAEMRFGTPGILAKHILEISGLTETAGDDAEKFRSDA
ncbi:hypothetical protein [[Eubacterium] cellulosolvens]